MQGLKEIVLAHNSAAMYTHNYAQGFSADNDGPTTDLVGLEMVVSVGTGLVVSDGRVGISKGLFSSGCGS